MDTSKKKVFYIDKTETTRWLFFHSALQNSLRPRDEKLYEITIDNCYAKVIFFCN